MVCRFLFGLGVENADRYMGPVHGTGTWNRYMEPERRRDPRIVKPGGGSLPAVKDKPGKLTEALRKFAPPLLRRDKPYPKRRLRGRRKTAGRLPDYRASLPGLVPRG